MSDPPLRAYECPRRQQTKSSGYLCEAITKICACIMHSLDAAWALVKVLPHDREVYNRNHYHFLSVEDF